MANLEDMPPVAAYIADGAEKDKAESNVADSRQNVGRFGHFSVQRSGLHEYSEVSDDMDRRHQEQNTTKPSVRPIHLQIRESI